MSDSQNEEIPVEYQNIFKNLRYREDTEGTNLFDSSVSNLKALEKAHSLMAATCLAGIFELAGGAPKDSRAIQMAIFCFMAGTIANIFALIKRVYISDYLRAKYSVGQLAVVDTFVTGFSIAGTLGGIAAIIHYYNTVFCYAFWISIIIIYLHCCPRQPRKIGGPIITRGMHKHISWIYLFIILFFFEVQFGNPNRAESWASLTLCSILIHSIWLFSYPREVFGTLDENRKRRAEENATKARESNSTISRPNHP